MPKWGCIADDITGATDLAGNFVERGYSTIVLFGTAALGPDAAAELAADDPDVVVVALKSRTAPVEEAVSDSLGALEFLRALGTERYYVKYCSTFDSTPRGNIGPVTDAVLTALGETRTIVVPSFPATGRTVYQGHLFVGGTLLSESHMRHHPLTPMTDSNVPRLLAAQSTGEVALVPLQAVRAGAAALEEEIDRVTADRSRRTAVVVDAVIDDDLRVIGEAASGIRVVTGGSGLALGLPRRSAGARSGFRVVPGPRATLCGSASLRTREQVAHAKDTGLPWRKIDPAALRADLIGTASGLGDWIIAQWAHSPGATPLVYSVDDPADVQAGDASGLVEEAFGLIAQRIVEAGCRQLIVAGGETSGQAIASLGIRSLSLGPAIDAGVSWSTAVTASGTAIDVALKSGNFGQPDMFTSAWALLDGGRA